jgi:hypothetical protein
VKWHGKISAAWVLPRSSVQMVHLTKPQNVTALYTATQALLAHFADTDVLRLSARTHSTILRRNAAAALPPLTRLQRPARPAATSRAITAAARSGRSGWLLSCGGQWRSRPSSNASRGAQRDSSVGVGLAGPACAACPAAAAAAATYGCREHGRGHTCQECKRYTGVQTHR